MLKRNHAQVCGDVGDEASDSQSHHVYLAKPVTEMRCNSLASTKMAISLITPDKTERLLYRSSIRLSGDFPRAKKSGTKRAVAVAGASAVPHVPQILPT